VHLNSENDSLLVSGYVNDVKIYDVESGVIKSTLSAAHSDHINISRFSNMSPHIFATSSFDKKAKTWDTRMPLREPIYTLQCNSGIVMINFSPDDKYLLTSALDNEITQFFAVDGARHSSFQIPKTGLQGNYTRAYYSSTGAYIVTGMITILLIVL
jgi:WD40 repeat protein